VETPVVDHEAYDYERRRSRLSAEAHPLLAHHFRSLDEQRESASLAMWVFWSPKSCSSGACSWPTSSTGRCTRRCSWPAVTISTSARAASTPPSSSARR
jgi:hypothetical protein